jgi:molybdate transport system substrate-binding protein
MIRVVLALAAALFLVLPNANAGRANALHVFSAIGMRQVLLELAPEFERATGHVLTTTFAATGLLAKRVAAGELVDVVVINHASVDALRKDGRVRADSIQPIARSVAAVAIRAGAPTPDVASADAFKRFLLAAGSVARPAPDVGGSSGDHIVDVLRRLGITAAIDAKSVFVTAGSDGQAAYSAGDAVAQGKAEVALHQLQELMAVPGIQVVGPFPPGLQGEFVFSAAIVTGSREIAAADALIKFLRSPRAIGIITAKGMVPS